jgi:uncharacterized FlaG/YvyC family protein
MAKLGEFSMSGLEASNMVENNLVDSGLPKHNAIDDLSEISSGIRENNKQDNDDKSNDPDSLESRLQNIRKDLKFEYHDASMDMWQNNNL